jgi:hypothetical protein
MGKIYIILIDTFVWLKGQQLLKNMEKAYNFIIKLKLGNVQIFTRMRPVSLQSFSREGPAG